MEIEVRDLKMLNPAQRNIEKKIVIKAAGKTMYLTEEQFSTLKQKINQLNRETTCNHSWHTTNIKAGSNRYAMCSKCHKFRELTMFV